MHTDVDFLTQGIRLYTTKGVRSSVTKRIKKKLYWKQDFDDVQYKQTEFLKRKTREAFKRWKLYPGFEEVLLNKRRKKF